MANGGYRSAVSKVSSAWRVRAPQREVHSFHASRREREPERRLARRGRLAR